MALVPMFQREDYDPATLFPRLLDGIEHPGVAAPILDLANWLMERQIAPRHPAADRAEELVRLLGGLVERLGRLEERPAAVGDAPAKRQWQFAQSIDLVVSLCRVLVLIGDESAVGVLDRVLKLGHRRLRCEATSAMARLHQQEGAEALLALAAEPVVRLCVLAYARELDQVDHRFTSPAAKAEGELVGWLAQPGQIGISPSECELIDSRTQHWPGWERPVACYLFRYRYQLPTGMREAVGIAGPLVHSFSFHPADLAIEDLYAVYVGWQAEHEEFHEVNCGQLTGPQQTLAETLAQRLSWTGYDRIEPGQLG